MFEFGVPRAKTIRFYRFFLHKKVFGSPQTVLNPNLQLPMPQNATEWT